MKIWHYLVLSLMALCVILGGGIYSQAWADEGLPDGLKILKEKMAKKDLPDADFAKFEFDIPDKLPDEINNLKGYLWSAQYWHPVWSSLYKRTTGAISYLFLLNYNKETGDIGCFAAWEAPSQGKPSWTILTGKIDAENKGKIELRTKYGNTFKLVIKNKDNVELHLPSGWEANMKKIGTISPPPK